MEATALMDRTEEAGQVTGWVRAAQEGDADSFARLMASYSGFALALATRRLGSRDAAEDAVQDAWIEAYACLAHLREPAAFAAWLRRIVLKQVDRVQRVRRVPVSPLDELLDSPAGEDQPDLLVERAERDSHLASALAALPGGTRDVVELFYLGGLSHTQIAAGLGIPVSTVKKRLYDGRQALRRALTAEATNAPTGMNARPPAGLFARVTFFVALAMGDLEGVQTALRAHPDLVAAREEWREGLASAFSLGFATRYTGLHRAAAQGNARLARCLLDAGADPDARATQDATPLHIAILNRWPTLVALLLQAGAHSEARTLQGMSPLHLAAMRCDAASIRLLLTVGASPDMPDIGGRTPRDWARLKGCDHLFPRIQ